MKRKVFLSKNIADKLLVLQEQARLRGERALFRKAWILMWRALHERPLPPSESAQVFGEIRYWTKYAPRFAICVGCQRPLVLHFAVPERQSGNNGDVDEAVNIVNAVLLS